MCVCVCVCVCTYMYIYICMYVCTHIHTHVYIYLLKVKLIQYFYKNKALVPRVICYFLIVFFYQRTENIIKNGVLQGLFK